MSKDNKTKDKNFFDSKNPQVQHLRNVPKLRFPEFTEEWNRDTLGKYLQKHDEKSDFSDQYPVLTSSRSGIYFQSDYYNGRNVASKDNTGYNVVPYGYFTYRHMSDDLVFKFNINNLCPRGIVSTLYPVFTTKDIHDEFLKYTLNEGKEFRRYAILQKQGGSRTYMYFNKLEKLKISMPIAEEQRKISNTLNVVDKKIELLTKKLENLKLFKKGLEQKLFARKNISPTLRFGEFEAEWEIRKAKDIFYNISNKNHTSNFPVIAVTQDRGVVFRDDIDINIISSESSIKNYKIVDIGNFVISLRTFQGGIEYSYIKGLCSPAYTIFDSKIKINKEYFRYFFKSKAFIDSLRILLTGIRDGKQISYNQFATILITYPKNEKEQKKIASFITSIDKKNILVEQQLKTLKQFKKGLLQQMFI